MSRDKLAFQPENIRDKQTRVLQTNHGLYVRPWGFEVNEYGARLDVWRTKSLPVFPDSAFSLYSHHPFHRLFTHAR